MKNKFLGSILIVAGTTIGGGMLAMPIISAAIGFKAILLVLISIWLIMCYTALLFLEVYKHSSTTEGFNSISQKYLGNWASITTAVCMIALMYALLAAYISGGGDVATDILSQWLGKDLAPEIGVLIFTVIFGGIVSLGTQTVDVFNKWIFAIKLVFLVIVLVLLSSKVQQVNLLSSPINRTSILLVLPVIFTSFGFHVNIPSIVAYMDGNQKKLKRIFIIGSALPLIIYILWQLMVLGSINQSEFMRILDEKSNIQGLLIAIRQMVDNPIINTSFNVFATAALVTSFLGVSLGLFDYIKDLSKKYKVIENTVVVSLLTFLPPLLFALFYPEGFVLALGYAAIPLAFLIIILPALLIRKVYQTYNITAPWYKTLSLWLVIFIGFGLIVLQLAIAMRYIEA